MEMSLAGQIMGAKAASTQTQLQTIMLKKEHEMDQMMISMLDSAAQSGPPPTPGTGTRVDKSA